LNEGIGNTFVSGRRASTKNGTFLLRGRPMHDELGVATRSNASHRSNDKER